MIERIGHIKNPLTVIAMFAGLAELSGTVVLPFLGDANQATYIQFLMWFPTLLVLLFFATLRSNARVLYAPSDWKDEKNFFGKFTSATSEEVLEKFESDFVTRGPSAAGAPEAAADTQGNECEDLPVKPDAPLQTSDKEIPAPPRGRVVKHMMGLLSLERAAIDRLSFETGKSFDVDVTYHWAKNERLVFDGLALEKDHVTAVEIRHQDSGMTASSIQPMLRRFAQAAKSFRDTGGAGFSLYLVFIVHEKELPNEVLISLVRETSRYEYPITLVLYDAAELRSGRDA